MNKMQFSLKDSLNLEDTETQTYGCRHSNPDICKNCYADNICAFVTEDSICKIPPKSWSKQYKILLKEGNNESRIS